jgi:hypothetical protein
LLYLAKEWTIILDVPRIKMLLGEREREAVIEEPELALLTDYIGKAHPTSLMRHILPFLVDTGLRISEACGLLRENVRFNASMTASLCPFGSPKVSRSTPSERFPSPLVLSHCLPQSGWSLRIHIKGRT